MSAGKMETCTEDIDSVKKINMSAGKMETCTEDIDRFTWQNYFSALYQQYNKH